MRFSTRYDRWLVMVVVLAAILTCFGEPLLAFFAPGSHPAPVWLRFLAWPLWILVLACMLPQYYEVRETGLFPRQGWRRTLIPWASVADVQSVSDARSAGVFSTQRLLITTSAARRFVIAVAQEERFLVEVARRCPQLDQRPFGLGIPFASPIS